MSFYRDQVLPRLIDTIMRRNDLEELRARVASKLTGDVLEIGFGSGLDVALYPAGVNRAWGVAPATGGRKLAAARVAASPAPIEYIGLDAQRIPLPDASVDSVLTTWTLCTIPDAAHALAEVRRVLRPGGTLSFVEHGRSPDLAVARNQRRLEPVQSLVFGGCKLTRPIDEIIPAGGLGLSGLKQYYQPGLRATSYTYEGQARRIDRT